MNRLDIYVDGSHLDKQHNGRLGVGGILVGNNKRSMIDYFQEELTSDYMLREFGAQKCSNPSAELVAVLKALKKFKKQLSKVDMIVIHADYIGVKEFLSGNWKCKEVYIANIKNAVIAEINSQGIQDKVSYEWVKGHQSRSVLDPDAIWNNKVDLLAKGEDYE